MQLVLFLSASVLQLGAVHRHSGICSLFSDEQLFSLVLDWHVSRLLLHPQCPLEAQQAQAAAGLKLSCLPSVGHCHTCNQKAQAHDWDAQDNPGAWESSGHDRKRRTAEIGTPDGD